MESNVRAPNFTEEFTKFIIEQYLDQEIFPEGILGYIYAILHSPTYRETFNEFLKIDFARIPFTSNYDTFKSLSKVGQELADLHLMKKKLKTTTKFDIPGSNVVKLVKYQDAQIFINKTQFFDQISNDAWNFYIGGYQVLDKWLKSRKSRELSSNEIEHFLQVVEVIKKAIEYMKEIDGIVIFDLLWFIVNVLSQRMD